VIELRRKPLRQNCSDQTFRDHERIIPERGKEFVQHFGLLRLGGHPIHLSLKFAGRDWRSSLLCDKA
jgi:hypothetical protein